MSAVYASLICVIGSICCLVLRQQKPEMATVLALATGITAATVCMEDIRAAVNTIGELTNMPGLENEYASTVLRACGISLIAEFSTQICMDAGETALAGRIKLALRLTLAVMAAPIMAEIMSLSLSFLQ